MKTKLLLLILSASSLLGCATAYQAAGGAFTGGYAAGELEPGIFRVSFYGNGYTTMETVQTYWLYKCTEVALENGYQGFEILSDISLTRSYPVEDFFLGKDPILDAQAMIIPVPSGPVYLPRIDADIQLLKAPFVENRPKIFDALKLQRALDPYVHAEKKCSRGNICGHFHKYLHPEGKFDKGI